MVDLCWLGLDTTYATAGREGTAAMPLLSTLRESCPDKISCPTVRLGPEGDLFVQGYVVSDPSLLAELALPSGETVVRIPAAVVPALLPELAAGSAFA